MRTIVHIAGTEYMFYRSAKASYSDRHNRAVKLAYQFEALSDKFDGMIKRGRYVTENARCALAVKLMMFTGIRIGNEGSAEGYMTKPHPNSNEKPMFVQTYGLTTMLREHVALKGRKVLFMFLGKRHVDNTFEIHGELARQVREFLKRYEGNSLLDITAYQLTKFIKKYVGRQFTPKDFRTMKANMLAYDVIRDISKRENPHTKSEYNKEVKEICTFVSENLNNTPGVCKKSYIDCQLWDEYQLLRPITKRRK